MANEKFYFLFSEEPTKKIYIDEPDGWGAVDHNLTQKVGGHGRDESLSGGEFQFIFNDQSNHALETLLYYNHRYKSQARVLMSTVFEDGTESVQQVHYPSAETDGLTYFKCKMIVKSSLQIVKRQSATMVDVFSSVGINREVIEPVEVSNMLLKAKPSIQESTWKQVAPESATIFPLAPNYFSLTRNLIDSEIKDSYVPFKFRSTQRSDMQMMEAQTNLKNVVVKLTNVEIIFSTVSSANINGNISYIKTSGNVDNSSPVSTRVYNFSGGNFSINQDFTINVGDMQRGDKLYLFIFAQTNGGSGITIKSCDVSMTAESTAYNTITPAVRLIHALKYVVKSISGLEVTAPRYELGGEYYDTFLTNGKLLAGIKDKPFYLSLEFLIDKCIRGEHNADSEIDLEERVFIGTENDYYQNIEIAVFDEVQYDQFVRVLDPMFCINEFKLSYSKFQSQKEGIESNSDSTIHGESFWSMPNMEVDNKKDIKIEWVRDSVLLDVQQRLSTIITKDTATQENDTVFAIDTIENGQDQQFTETTTLQHTYDGINLYLRNNGEDGVNFVVLGIRENTNFNIAYPDPNSGDYLVTSVLNNELKLLRTSGGSIGTGNDGIRLTKYTYEIKKETIPITNRTNEGFTYINNLIAPEKYSNLRYSNKRNVINSWNSYLAACNLGSKESEIINSLYRNNGECETEYNGLRLKENGSFVPDDPIMTGFLFKNIVVANMEYSTFIHLQNELRGKRGFIRTKDNKGQTIRVFHKDMSYVAERSELIFTGYEKFESSYMTIVNEPNNILINGETRIVRLDYKIVNKYQVAIFDKERQRLYPPVYWDMVSVNGQNAETITQLEDWLKILQ